MAKILLVEDQPKYSDAAQRYLESRGHAVVLAKDYSEAVEHLTDSSVDGVITDCFFPEMAGTDHIDLGMQTIQKMEESDPREKRATSVSKAIAKVTELFGPEVAKHFAENARVDYKAEVDLYDVMRDAVKAREDDQPLGVLVAEQAKAKGLPVVMATSTYHHDQLTQRVQDYAHRTSLKLMDCGPDAEEQKESEQFWEQTVRALESRL